MAFRQFTSCVKPGNYVDLGFNPVGISFTILMTGVYLLIAFAIASIAGGTPAILAALAVVASLITYLEWWLHGRLICLGDHGGDNCAIIGMVLSHGHSDPTKKAGDNDYTMNVLLAPGPLNLNSPVADYHLPPQGHLVTESQEIMNIGRSYVQDADHQKYLKHLHCEFEGSGIQDMLDSANVVFGFLLIALAVPWPLNLFVALLAAIIAIFSALTGIFANRGAPGSGNPLDVSPNLGTMDSRDVIVVKGDWIYDSLHDGWNEIHAVHDCQIIGHLADEQGWNDFTYTDLNTGVDFKLDTKENVENFRKFWCEALKGAEQAEEGGNRDDPKHDWGIHPSIDGCEEPPIIT